jgi:hypothetical protein
MSVSNEFLEPPSELDIARAEDQWRSRQCTRITNLEACMVCSIEIEDYEDSRDLEVESIPNKNLLAPETYHPAHELHDGMLLDTSALREESGVWRGQVCNPCLQDLQDAVPPVLSLANGSWIGPVPATLQGLTIAEQSLIALHPHTTYHIGFKGDPGSPVPYVRHRTLHPMAAECMEPAKCLPGPSEVLVGALCIDLPHSIAFNETLFDCFMVRRQKVLDALLWLKDHNCFYQDVMISRERVSRLPVQGVPIDFLQYRVGEYETRHDYHRCTSY